MSDSELKPSHIPGCLSAILHLFGVLPMWFALLIGLLIRTDAPGWMWATLWTYIPMAWIGGMLMHWAQELKESE